MVELLLVGCATKVGLGRARALQQGERVAAHLGALRVGEGGYARATPPEIPVHLPAKLSSAR